MTRDIAEKVHAAGQAIAQSQNVPTHVEGGGGALINIVNRLQQQLSRINNATEITNDYADRVFGAQPPSQQPNSQAAETPTDVTVWINYLIDEIDVANDRLNTAIARFGGL